MKKSLSVLVVLVMLFACFASFTATASADPDPAIGDLRELTIYKVSEAPTLDGVIEDDEYPLVTSWPDDDLMTFRGDYATNMDIFVYMCYDDEYVYYAIKAECDSPHVAYVEGEHYIFNAHSLMTVLIPDDPSNEIYPDSSATWTDLYNGGFCYEWTLAIQDIEHGGDGTTVLKSDHFGTMTSQSGFEYACQNIVGEGTDKDWDVYEMRIPWASMYSSKQTTALTGTEGTIFGMDFTVLLTDYGDGYDSEYKGNYVYLAGCYPEDNAKDLSGCAKIILGGEYDGGLDISEDESSEEPDETSEPAVTSSEETSSGGTTPTGDSGIAALAIISVIALAGAVVIKRK
ncbi:MAG: hypothetical protein GX148_05555 [Clostridiales bacterium]|nr:hypothetical protein [Clostridiales bacterium]